MDTARKKKSSGVRRRVTLTCLAGAAATVLAGPSPAPARSAVKPTPPPTVVSAYSAAPGPTPGPPAPESAATAAPDPTPGPPATEPPATGAPNSAAPATAAPTRSPAPALRATVSLTGAGPTIPPAFFGLSMEYDELPVYESEGPVFDRVLSLLRPRGGGPMVLRVGGRSADQTYWKTPKTPASEWVFEIGSGWLGRLAALAGRDDLRVMLDLNLAVHSPAMAAGFATAARSVLPASRLAGFEVGNEPDDYVHEPFLDDERIATTIASTPPNWTRTYSPSEYRRDYRAYARAVRSAAPGVPLAAPDLSSVSLYWLKQLSSLGSRRPQLLTLHRYPTSACWPAGSPYRPTIPLLLSKASSAGLAGTVRAAASFARRKHLGVRVTEMNSVTCGGNLGVANSFATALWAPDALFAMIRAGAVGVNFHFRPFTINAPFHPTTGGITPEPELYGLALFQRMVAPGARLMNLRMKAAPGLYLKAWAVRSPGALRVLLINKGPRAAKVALRLGPNEGPAGVSALWAPTVGSSTGVTLGGRWIGDDARWHGPSRTAPATERQGAYHTMVAGYSAELVTVGAQP